jgi:hypothetical protein
MVTFFKVHLRIVGPCLPRRRAPVADPRGFSAGQLASGYTDPPVKISRACRRATHMDIQEIGVGGISSGGGYAFVPRGW